MSASEWSDPLASRIRGRRSEMTRNLVLLGLGLLVAGALGLFAPGAVPAGVLGVNDTAAAQVYGGQEVCPGWKEVSDPYGCGLDAKPGPMKTQCPKWNSFVPGQVYYFKYLLYLDCYECCYACGQYTYLNGPCSPPGSGP
jgi:hypothetical protein